MKSAKGGMSSARKGCMESRQRRVCYQSEGEGGYTLARDAILRGAQITSNGQSPLITYQSFGLDKKLSNPIGLLNFFIQADEGGLVCNQCACALYVIATKSRMASRASVHVRRLDYIQHFVLIPYSPYGLRTYRLRRISFTATP